MVINVTTLYRICHYKNFINRIVVYCTIFQCSTINYQLPKKFQNLKYKIFCQANKTQKNQTVDVNSSGNAGKGITVYLYIHIRTYCILYTRTTFKNCLMLCPFLLPTGMLHHISLQKGNTLTVGLTYAWSSKTGIITY